MARYHQGRFKPKNPSKYKGDPTNIIYRSRWELLLMRWLDTHPNVMTWSSEELIVPYRSPIDGRYHRYFPDFMVEQLNKNGKKETVMIEVKPKKETRPPEKANGFTSKGTPRKRYLTEVKTWGVNQAKWKAAQEYCDDRGWRFQIMTEDHLF